MWRNMSQLKQSCTLSKIYIAAPTPEQMLQKIIDKLELTNNPLVMNLATLDKEFGVMNRSVIYRGLTEDNTICFVTERNSRKYKNLKENPTVSVTMLCPTPEEFWQIRLFNAEAHELSDDMIKRFWQQELLFSKIRSHICECGKPIDDGQNELERKCQEIVEKYEKENKEPEQTKSYTAFKIVSKIWDFYMSEPQKIADRVQYKQIEGEKDKWEIYHVHA